jgi:hypothetical protein
LGIFFIYTGSKDLFANKLQRRGGHSFDVVLSNLKVDLIDVSKSIFSYYNS